MLGIGAAHQKDPNGIAWKQNKDFENLLRRLNAANGEGEEVKTNVSGFSRAVESNLDGATNGVASMTVVEVREEVTMDVDEEGEKTKKSKKSKKEKKSKKDKDGKRKRSEEEEEEKDAKKLKTVEELPTPPVEAEAPPKRSFVPRHRAYVSSII
jgi:Pin2-interacting protein X1